MRARRGAKGGRGPGQSPRVLSLRTCRDGHIDADEVEQVFKQLGHKCKRVRRRVWSRGCRLD